MGETLAQKIIRAHLLHGDMTPGSEIALRIDQTLTQDATARWPISSSRRWASRASRPS